MARSLNFALPQPANLIALPVWTGLCAAPLQAVYKFIETLIQ